MTPAEIDALLAGFRDWLLATVAASDAAHDPIALARQDVEPPDLHSLLSQLVALKQEVNLQTRTTRSQQEQNAETLRQLTSALETLEANCHDADDVPEVDDQAEQLKRFEQLRPLLKTMVDAHDALSLAQREVRRIQNNLQTQGISVDPPLPAASEAAQSAAETSAPPRLSWLARWLGVSQPVARNQENEHELRLTREHAANLEKMLQGQRSDVRTLVDSIVTGYTMSLQRLERALEQHGLTPIACVGEIFDPETMEVVEVVQEPGRSTNEVVEEVRRGYLWQTRIFRFAQVKVARPARAQD